MSEKKEHRNIAVVFGQIADFNVRSSEGGKKYMQVRLDCPNDLHGNVKVFGRLWNEQKFDSLKNELKSKDNWKGTALRFDGFLEQYTKDGKVMTNFTFYHWRPYKGDEFRAAFTMRGVVGSIDKDVDDDVSVMLDIRRSAGGENIKEESLNLFSEEELEIKSSDTCKLKGVIREQGEEDYYGETSGIFKPYILEVIK